MKLLYLGGNILRNPEASLVCEEKYLINKAVKGKNVETKLLCLGEVC